MVEKSLLLQEYIVVWFEGNDHSGGYKNFLKCDCDCDCDLLALLIYFKYI